MYEGLKKSIIKGIGWKFAERIIAQGVSFVVSILLARILMPEDYGKVAIICLFITLADVLVSSGLGTALIQDQNAKDEDFSTIFYCSLILSVIMYFLLFSFAPLIAKFYKIKELSILIRIFSLRVILGAYNTVQHAYIIKKMEFQKFFWGTLVGTIISALLGIILALNGLGVWALVVQYLSNSAIDSFVLSFIISWHPQKVFSMERAKVLVGYGWKIMCADFLGTFFNQIQTVFIGGYYNATQLAFYNKGNQIPNAIFNNITGSMSSVLFSAFSKCVNNVQKKELTRQVVKKIAYIFFPAVAVLLTVSDVVIIVLFTSKWKSCVKFMKYGVVGVAFCLIGEICIQVVKATGRSDIVLKIELLKKPLYLIMLMIALKKGVLAIAQITCIYSIIVALINLEIMGKVINYSFIEQVKDLLIPGLLSLVLVFSLYELNCLLKMENEKIVYNLLALGAIYLVFYLIGKKDKKRKVEGKKYGNGENI